MENDRKIVEGFEHWTQSEEDDVCYIPSSLCCRVLDLLKNSKRVTRCKDCKFFAVRGLVVRWAATCSCGESCPDLY